MNVFPNRHEEAEMLLRKLRDATLMALVVRDQSRVLAALHRQAAES